MKKSKSFLPKMMTIHRFSRSDFAICLILCIGVFLRVWQIETKMIFFADAGRDMLAAVEMNKTGEIPLLGIPSSVPRFKQGPLFVWFEALIFKTVGINPVAVGYCIAFINSLALLFCFAIVKKHINTSAALLTTLLLATSPLAVAHSRMPYHVTPIISFLLFYLWNLQRLIEKKRLSFFWSSLSFALLFQFELALFPLILFIPYIIWKTKQWKKLVVPESLAGLVIGVLPQIIFDLTHQFSQLGGFLLWLVYRIVSFFWIGKSHAVSLNQLTIAWNIFIHYFSQIFSLDHFIVGLFFLILVLGSIMVVLRNSSKNIFLQIVALSITLLLLALFIHGTPSEAYFPPIILFSCMIIGAGVTFMPKKSQLFLGVLFVIIASVNSLEIVKNNFFVLPTLTGFQYGPSYAEQVQVMKFITNQSTDGTYELKSIDPDSHFETYLDNFRVIGVCLARSQNALQQNADQKKLFFINMHNSELTSYPFAKITFFPNVDVIEIPKDL